MGSDYSEQDIPLPRGWTKHAKSALIRAVSLAATALNLAYGQTTTSKSARNRLDRATTEIALLTEELDIKDARWSRLPSRRRPYYTPVQRMRILQLKAARGWSCERAARAFLINEQTLRSWLERVDEQRERSLIQTAEPVNRFPEFVRSLVQRLSVLLPSMGKVRIVQVLARAGLHLGATTVGRMLKEDQPLPEDAAATLIEVDVAQTRVVTAIPPSERLYSPEGGPTRWTGQQSCVACMRIPAEVGHRFRGSGPPRIRSEGGLNRTETPVFPTALFQSLPSLRARPDPAFFQPVQVDQLEANWGGPGQPNVDSHARVFDKGSPLGVLLLRPRLVCGKHLSDLVACGEGEAQLDAA